MTSKADNRHDDGEKPIQRHVLTVTSYVHYDNKTRDTRQPRATDTMTDTEAKATSDRTQEADGHPKTSKADNRHDDGEKPIQRHD